MSGVLTYRRMLVGTMLLRKLFRNFPASAVGVLLPASVGADLTFFGLLMAGKLPAMLNWTLGPSHLRQAVEKLSLRRIVTSRKLVDRLGIQSPGAEFVFHGGPSRGSWQGRGPGCVGSLLCSSPPLAAQYTASRPRPARRGAVHIWLGKLPEGGSAESRESDHQCPRFDESVPQYTREIDCWVSSPPSTALA